jgi:hypothetical protein
VLLSFSSFKGPIVAVRPCAKLCKSIAQTAEVEMWKVTKGRERFGMSLTIFNRDGGAIEV